MDSLSIAQAGVSVFSSANFEGEEFEYLLGQIYIHVINEELELQKKESEDGKNRRYDFAKPYLQWGIC